MRRLFRQAFRSWRSWAFPTLFAQLASRKIWCRTEDTIEEEVEATMSKIFFSPEQCEHTDIKIFSFGGGVLSSEIVSHLDISLGKHETIRFSDGEINMSLLDSVSGHKVFIVKTFEDQKVNEGLIELMLAVSCMKKCGAAAYLPAYSASSQGEDAPKTFFVPEIAKLLESCGCDMIITMNGQLRDMKGFTNTCTFINIDCSELVVPYLIHKEINKPVIVGTSLNPFYSSHIQSLRQTFNYFDLQCDVGFYYSDDFYVGSDVKGRDIIVFENIIRSGQKIRSRVRDLKSKGANDIYCFAAHGLAAGDELNRIVNQEGIKELILFNTIQQSSEVYSFLKQFKSVRYISVGKLLAEMICLIHRDMSLNDFRNERGILKMAFVEKIRRFAASQPSQPTQPTQT